MDGVAAATSHKFANGQEIFGCYDIDLFLDERGMTGNCPSFHRQRSHRMRKSAASLLLGMILTIVQCL